MRQRTLAGSIAPEEPEPLPAELALPEPVFEPFVSSAASSPSPRFDHDPLDHHPGSDDESSSSSVFCLAAEPAATGQSAAWQAGQVNWILEALEPVVANVAANQYRFRRGFEPSAEYQGIVRRFTLLLKDRRKAVKAKLGRTMLPSCWREMCSMMPMRHGVSTHAC